MPFLASILSRAQEYTADNFGYRYCPRGSEGTIRTLAAGKYLNKDVNFQELADRAVYERGLFTWLANLNMSHPATTWRAHALRDRSRPGRLIWRPRLNPANNPLSMVPAAEPAASWPDPLQSTEFLGTYPEKPGNAHWGVNVVSDKEVADRRDRVIPDLLDIYWAGPGRRGFGGPNGPAGPEGQTGPNGPTGTNTTASPNGPTGTTGSADDDSARPRRSSGYGIDPEPGDRHRQAPPETRDSPDSSGDNPRPPENG